MRTPRLQIQPAFGGERGAAGLAVHADQHGRLDELAPAFVTRACLSEQLSVETSTFDRHSTHHHTSTPVPPYANTHRSVPVLRHSIPLPRAWRPTLSSPSKPAAATSPAARSNPSQTQATSTSTSKMISLISVGAHALLQPPSLKSTSSWCRETVTSFPG